MCNHYPAIISQSALLVPFPYRTCTVTISTHQVLKLRYQSSAKLQTRCSRRHSDDGETRVSQSEFGTPRATSENQYITRSPVARGAYLHSRKIWIVSGDRALPSCIAVQHCNNHTPCQMRKICHSLLRRQT